MPIFDMIGGPSDKITLFDLEGVLAYEKPHYDLKGIKKIPNGYVVRWGALRILQRAREDFDWVVVWNASDLFMKFGNRLFSRYVDQKIFGSEHSRGINSRPIKSIRRFIASDVTRVTALEDDGHFFPGYRAVQMYRGDSLTQKYLEMKELARIV